MPVAASFTAFDQHMMAIALRMATGQLGATHPNPAVGAVIADERTDEVIARGATARGGRPHAEVVAIERAGSRAKRASIYVTLEPCAHHGQTGPCAEAVIAAGLRRAVVAIEDPDPRVSGRGVARLRAAGIDVVLGCGAAEARWLTRGHIVRVTERRPFITLKLALDAEGRIARGTGQAPVWVSGPLSRAHAMMLRAQTDAILVGSRTVEDDDPELTCRLPGLIDRSPVRVVLSGRLSISLQSKLVRTAPATPLWLATAAGSVPARSALADAGATVFDVPKVGGDLWLAAVMEALVARGITRLLVEGGPAIWRAFGAAALYDEIVLYMSGRPDEGAARRAINAHIGDADLEPHESRIMGGDTFWRFRRSFRQEGR